MKNKIFKALGVCAVATLGLFTFTGCSLSDSEKAKLMNELDNATEYMEETIDQLKDQNKKLKEQNEILKQQNETAKGGLEESKTTNSTLLEQLEELKKQVKALEDGLLAEQEENEILGDSLTESEKTNTTLSQYLEELKKQVKVLEDSLSAEQEQNDILEDYLQEIQSENLKITNEQAFDKIKLAKAMLETNCNDVRNNLRLTTIVSSNKTSDKGVYLYESYKTENNGFVINFQQEIENKQYQSSFTYEYDEKVYSYDKKERSATTDNYTKEILTRYETSEAASMIENLFNQFIDFEETADKVKSVEVLENGNYKVILVNEVVKEKSESNFVTETSVVVYEITPTNQIKSMSVYMYNYQDLGTDEKTTSLYNGAYKMEFEYGVISENYINNLLQEAINKDLKSN